MTQSRLRSKRAVLRPLLGTMSDRALAILVGVSQVTVQRLRVHEGIAPFRWRTAGAFANRYQDYLCVLCSHHGIRAAAVARALGVSREAVRTMLRRLEDRGLAYDHCTQDDKGHRVVLWYAPSPSTNEEPLV